MTKRQIIAEHNFNLMEKNILSSDYSIFVSNKSE